MREAIVQRSNIANLGSQIGQIVKIQGWLHTKRDQKKMQFLVVRDTSGTVQVVLEKKRNPELAEQISRLTVETALSLTGLVVDNPDVKLGGLEIQIHSLQVETLAYSPLALDPFADTLPSIDYRMDWRFLDLRRRENLLLFQVATTVEMAMREFWVRNRFVEVHTPKLMGSPSESGAELFELPYFETKAYLAQSPQFYKQMAIAAGFERVYEIGPVFRADPSFTSRHMTEFTGVDMEMAWIDSHEDLMNFMEAWLVYIYQRVAEVHGKEIYTCLGVKVDPPCLPFPRIPMAKAHEILQSMGYQVPPERNGDMEPGGERVLGKWVKDHYGHDFVFLTDWPVSVRPFYHMHCPDQSHLTRSYDLLGKGLEITTGAQREHRYEVLAQQALEKGLRLETIQFYLDFFRFGCPPHGGFGFGLARFLMVLLELPNIRDAVFLFRGPARLFP
jgi:aspartyl-tRNA synthetase